MVIAALLYKGWTNILNHEAQKVLKFNRQARPGACAWSVLVIHLIRERNNMAAGQKNALILTEK